jgi:tRNA pseudouridine38-40 synthase
MNFLTFKIQGNFLVVTVEANAFLRHMVRNIVGTLVEVGRGKMTAADIKKILSLKNRGLSGPTAPAHGLFLQEIFY